MDVPSAANRRFYATGGKKINVPTLQNLVHWAITQWPYMSVIVMMRRPTKMCHHIESKSYEEKITRFTNKYCLSHQIFRK